ncbi:MAG: hypothetical protein QOF79_274 [Actinomycetota bacterium]|nr:hypothetical protein [Actinomycetota bacterium]
MLAIGVGLAGCALFGSAPAVNTVGKSSFTNPLKIPRLAPSTVDADGTRIFDLTAQTGQSRFLPGKSTTTSGYNGSYLGPTLRARLGEKVRVRVHNELAQPTTLHWHGMHLPAIADGGPHQPIAPGAQADPAWTIRQPAATLWYHPHPDGKTERQVRDGLAGMFIVDDPSENALAIPHEYGVDDVPVILQDVAFDASNQLTDRDGGFSGSLGDQLLVNGTLSPHFDVTTDVVRLRLVNASVARVYNFDFSGGRGFDQIASDGGLLDRPVPMTALQLSPGERAEILVSVSAGETVVLRSEQPKLGRTSSWNGTNGSQDRFDVLQLRASGRLVHEGGIPTALEHVERIDASSAATTRKFTLEGHEINGEQMAMNRIDAVVTLGTTEIWDVTNTMETPHNFHVHDLQFQILDIDGSAPPPGLAGWKDTVYLPPNSRFRLIMQFTDYADPDHPYMFHCHFLRHEDGGMMGQFIVVEPGQELPGKWDTKSGAVGSHDMGGMDMGTGN